MNCQNVLSNMGFRCSDLGEDTLRILSPFTYGADGEYIGLYVEKISTGYRITDNCESLMHASSMGINLTPGKLRDLQKSIGYSMVLSDGGELQAYVSEEELGKGVASVLNASLSVSHFEPHWAPRVRAESFTKNVAGVLEETLGEHRILRSVKVTGGSGHQLELPIAIERVNAAPIYVQPIATTEERKVDWKSVYAGWGRMTDLKKAHLESSSRVVVFEDAANDDEANSAIGLLAESATVVHYSKLRGWARKKAA